MTRTERLLRLARLRGDRAAELILCRDNDQQDGWCVVHDGGVFDGDGNQCSVHRDNRAWTETELRAAWGDR